MEPSQLQLVLGMAIFAILFSIGIGLAFRDFLRIIASPRAFLVVLLCQVLLLPGLAVLIARSFGLDHVTSFGLLLLAVCPGGVTSNVFTRMAGGFTALSVALTACNSMLAVVTIPAVLFIGQKLLGLQAQVYAIPLDYLAGQLLVITFVPVVLGMLVRHFLPAAAQRLERWLLPLTTALFFGLVVCVWFLEFDRYQQAFLLAGAPVVTLFVAACALSILIARALGLERGERIAMVFEVGVQNPPVAFFIAVSIVHDMALMPASAVYAVVMVVGSLVIVPLLRRLSSAQ